MSWQFPLRQCFLATLAGAVAFYCIRYGGVAGFAAVATLAVAFVETLRNAAPVAVAPAGWMALAFAMFASLEWQDSELHKCVTIPLDLIAYPGGWLASVVRNSGEGVSYVRPVLVLAFYATIAGWAWLRPGPSHVN